jgi:hypothetical protein
MVGVLCFAHLQHSAVGGAGNTHAIGRKETGEKERCDRSAAMMDSRQRTRESGSVVRIKPV